MYAPRLTVWVASDVPSGARVFQFADRCVPLDSPFVARRTLYTIRSPVLCRFGRLDGCLSLNRSGSRRCEWVRLRTAADEKTLSNCEAGPNDNESHWRLKKERAKSACPRRESIALRGRIVGGAHISPSARSPVQDRDHAISVRSTDGQSVFALCGIGALEPQKSAIRFCRSGDM